ncbi:hypothetical protein EON63_24345 [archaeon]|nr:MAG: hypothetical protein EON63_24345 [archaeon]
MRHVLNTVYHAPYIIYHTPYTIHHTPYILSGSSSMASVCSVYMSMCDAGVPVTERVGGVAMGLIVDEGGDDDGALILTDILGLEDALGTMDLKVAGSEGGVTAIQLDSKVGYVHTYTPTPTHIHIHTHTYIHITHIYTYTYTYTRRVMASPYHCCRTHYNKPRGVGCTY